MRYDVLVVGDYSIDLIFAGLPAFPELGRDVVGDKFAMLPGEAYNSAIAMHRLGLKVGWAADFGNDDLSQLALRHVRAEGLDETLFVQHKRAYRRISVAASYPEDRAFITYYDPAPAQPAALKALLLASARAVYVPGFFCGPLLEAGSLVTRAKRMQLILDGNSSDDKVTLTDPAVRKAVALADVFLPNAREARRMTGQNDLGQAARALAEHCALVVVKDGAGGAYACASGHLLHAPAISVMPVDTTGAGDCFNAGFIKAYLSDYPLDECLRWGNVVGGLSTLALGGTGRVITEADVHNLAT